MDDSLCSKKSSRDPTVNDCVAIRLVFMDVCTARTLGRLPRERAGVRTRTFRNVDQHSARERCSTGVACASHTVSSGK
jgi:hypothetical protein